MDIGNSRRNRGIMPVAGKVAHILRERIRSGEYAVGDSIENERELAKTLGVSRESIRKALTILETERLIVRHQGRGTFVTDSMYAPAKETQHAFIGILASKKEHFFELPVQAASIQCANRGYTLATGSNESKGQEDMHIQSFLRNGVSGVVVVPWPHYSSKNYQRLIEADIPVVLFDSLIPNISEDFVGTDNRMGIFIAVKHLVELGHTEIGYIGHNNSLDIPIKLDRLRGFVETCGHFGIAVDDSWIIETDEEHYAERLQEVFKAESRPSAFVAYNDTWAIRVIGVARGLGIRIPEQLSVTGFDDTVLARNYDIPITSVNPEYTELGRSIVNLLIEKIENPIIRPKRSILVSPSLTIRKSTAKVSR